VLTTHTRQLIAEAGLETGIDTDCADQGLLFQDDLISGHNTTELWEDHSDDEEDNNVSVDSRVASAIYRYVFLLLISVISSRPYLPLSMNLSRPRHRHDQRTRRDRNKQVHEAWEAQTAVLASAYLRHESDAAMGLDAPVEGHFFHVIILGLRGKS
jgi:hypothetical protein